MEQISYDFTTFFDRRGQDAYSVDNVKGVMEGYDIIPMWVADMSFPTAPPVIKAIQSRLDMQHFGYFDPRSYAGTDPATASNTTENRYAIYIRSSEAWSPATRRSLSPETRC